MAEKDRPQSSAPRSDTLRESALPQQETNFLDQLGIKVLSCEIPYPGQDWRRVLYRIGDSPTLLQMWWNGHMTVVPGWHPSPPTFPPTRLPELNRPPIERLEQLCGRMTVLVSEAESIVQRLRRLEQAALAAESPPKEAPAQPVQQPAVVHFDGPIIAQCDRLHVDDVVEEDEFYLDLTKKGLAN